MKTRLRWFTEEWGIPLLMIAMFAVVMFSPIGCVSASPERQAHRAVATTITTVNAAIDVWFAYVQQEERALVALQKSDPGGFMARRRALTINEGKVASAWEYYVAAQRALILGAAALGPGELPNPAEAKRLEAEIIVLVQTLTR
jgi:hypothetical protein